MAFVLCGWGSCGGAPTQPPEVGVLRQGHTQRRPPMGQSRSGDSGLATGPPGPCGCGWSTADGERLLKGQQDRTESPSPVEASEPAAVTLKINSGPSSSEGRLFNQLLTPQVLNAQVRAGGPRGGTPPRMMQAHQHQAASLLSLLRPGRGPGSLSHCSPAPLGPSS